METDVEKCVVLEKILELLVSAGYYRATICTLSTFDKLTGGLAWCISAAAHAHAHPNFYILYHDEQTLGDKIKVGEAIEAALRSMECPFPLHAHQLQGLDYDGVYPVIQWIVSRVLTMREELGAELRRYSHLQFQNHFELLEDPSSNPERNDVSPGVNGSSFHQLLHRMAQKSETCPASAENGSGVQRAPTEILHLGNKQSSLMNSGIIDGEYNEDPQHQVAVLMYKIEEENFNVHQLQELLVDTEKSIEVLHGSLSEQDHRKTSVLNEIQLLTQKIDQAGAISLFQRLMSHLEQLKLLEKQEAEFRSHCKQKRSDLQDEVIRVEKEAPNNGESESDSCDMDPLIDVASRKLDAAHRDFSVKMRAISLLKRKVDDVPSQTELIQYERRFAELFGQIQDKLRQTRRYYGTYNALIETKELSLKEISLLNSISSQIRNCWEPTRFLVRTVDQFQNAMASANGRSKLIDSFEDIAKGTQQKLEKMQCSLQVEQKSCNSIKEVYATAVAQQRHCSVLLKAFEI
ncbi:coiled-coil domain-containing protein 93 isoform X3 [Amborella trichopoda]|uniref:coiled-coil domain-containing protein 93 isoform X3 n=1 Tax=Amborella trichopoda TaxID=13333 RepID=UPI0009C0C457|nr:coiled-coil domain-containing protein 93 isoform X3 [Amborella trichopoda]|eukprot:XP_020517496.1 coiled-coil domain-containing protein 93 isoform X3 [Amborella trichopoda]